MPFVEPTQAPAAIPTPEQTGQPAEIAELSTADFIAREIEGLRAALAPGTLAWALKRTFDVSLVVLTLPLTAPLMALSALAMKLAAPKEPIFFSQTRLGYLGRPFAILKFRSMRSAGSETAHLPDDVRLTALGRFLRRSSLDELPQVLNILRGEMSWVGPRPLNLEDSEAALKVSAARFGVPPGITGLAQVDYGASATAQERHEADLEYAQSLSAFHDLGILARTPAAVLRTFFVGAANQSILLGMIRSLGRRQKQIILLLVDSALTTVALFLAYGLRLGIFPESGTTFLWMISAVLCVRIPTFAWLGLYRLKLSTRSQDFSRSVIIGSVVSALAVFIPLLLAQTVQLPRLVFLIEAPLAAMLIIGSREAFSSLIYSRRCRNRLQKPVLIYGAGNVGTQLALSLQADEQHEFRPIAFLDDDASKQGLKLYGLEVLSPEVVKSYSAIHRVDTVLLSIPSLKGWERAPLIEKLQSSGLSVQTVPSLIDIVSGKRALDDVREITADDLLERDSVPPIPELLAADVKNKVVCVTGAGGSIGSELCRQIASNHPAALVLVEQSELNLYEIEMELGRVFPNLKLAAILGSVCDRKRMDRVLQGYQVKTLYHAAAYKHVPMVEQNPLEGVRNNVLGTLAVAQAAADASVEKFVLISTDKAVRPTNVMGATKRVAEEVCSFVANQCRAEGRQTIFGMVRFGNVLDSTGSVVPLFRDQISRGEDLTVTDPGVTRYFMTIQEAAQLVMQAGAQATSEEVFLLDMGEPIKVIDLAERMIQLHTHAGNGGSPVKIKITGLRPGEKLYEEMFLDKNKAEPTLHQKIWCATESSKDGKEIASLISSIQKSVDTEDSLLLSKTLNNYVEGYAPQGQAEDLASGANFGHSFAGNHDTSLCSAPRMPPQQ